MSKKEYNTIYNCCMADPWLDVVDKLEEELNIIPSYFIGWKTDNSIDIQKKHPNCFYQTIEDAWRGTRFPQLDYTLAIDEEELKKYSFEKLLAIKMMDRLDLSRQSFSYSNRELYFNKLLKYWLTIVDEYNINLIISTSVPHRVFDYVLYIVAKMKNIEILMFQMTPFPDSSFILSEIEQTPQYIKEYLKTSTPQNKLREDIEKKLVKVQEDYNAVIPDYMLKQQENLNKRTFKKNMLNRFKNLFKNPLSSLEDDNTYYTIKMNDTPDNKSNLTYHRKIARHKNTFYLKEMENRYNLLSQKANFSDKYIFIALHYQPEETSTPTGGIFSNQILMIELLHSFLDKEYKIYVKEHKTQFNPNHDGALGRHKNYYNDILNISDRIKIINIETTPFDLIDNAIATVTISGTTGWESAVRGTPSLIFGRSWYEDMPGVFKIKSYTDLKQNWSNILKQKNNISIDEIKKYHINIQHFFIDAPHYKFFKDKVQRSAEENCANICNGIYKHLKRINFLANS